MEKQLAARKSEYDERVERAKEAREMVVESLESLTANDTAVLKAMKNPPKPVKLVAEAIAYIKVGVGAGVGAMARACHESYPLQ